MLPLTLVFHCFFYVFSLKDLCINPIVKGNETLKKTCYLVQGAMMHEHCRREGKNCLENRALVSNQLVDLLSMSLLIMYMSICAGTLDIICN